MIVLIAITLICAFASNFPSIEADLVSSSFGDLAHGTTKPPIADPLAHGINHVVCSLLSPFLILFCEKSQHSCCPKELRAPQICESYETYCEWLKNGGPQLQECATTTLLGGQLNVKGIIDIRAHIGKCCNIPWLYKSQIGAQIADGLMDGEILNNGLVGKLAYGALNTANDLVCSLLTPNFLRVLFTTNKCSNGIQLSSYNGFETLQSFCEYFNSCSPHTQKCLSDAVAWGAIETLGIGEGYLGRCCTHYTAKKPEIPTPTCKAICESPETPTKCNC